MTKRRVAIFRQTLGYAGGLVLHTATSGAVPTLDEVRLVVEDGGRLVALGSTRINIIYLSGIPAATIEQAIVKTAQAIDWHGDLAVLAAAVDQFDPHLPAAARMLFEMAAADAAARSAEMPLAHYLRGAPVAELTATATNQTLFWQDDASLIARARGYIERGFLDLKLRIGIGAFEDDLRRLTLLRDTFGAALRLSADVNGRWIAASAERRLDRLAALHMEYIEQPLPADAWDETLALSKVSPVPIMLDESLSSSAAIDRLIATRAAPLAHLKLAKIGGLDRLMRAARKLMAADIGVMIGQMNEGAVSTLAAAHAAIALDAPLRELYGADQITSETATPPLAYRDGVLEIPRGAGLGIAQAIPPGITPIFEEILS